MSRRRRLDLRAVEVQPPACDSGEWPCRHTPCPHCLAALSRLDPDPDLSWCELVLRAQCDREITLDAIGAELGLTRERVRQLEEGALAKLRDDSRAARALLAVS